MFAHKNDPHIHIHTTIHSFVKQMSFIIELKNIFLTTHITLYVKHVYRMHTSVYYSPTLNSKRNLEIKKFLFS